MRIIASLLFPKSSIIFRGEAKGNSWCWRQQQICYHPNIQSINVLLYQTAQEITIPCTDTELARHECFFVILGFQNFSSADEKPWEFWMFNVERGLKIPRKYIASEVNGTRVVNSLLDYSVVNSSLHNLPVNMIFLL